MQQLSLLERAALDAICRQQTDQRDALASQLASAKVIQRRNSGAGFFTDLAIDRTAPPVTSKERVIGNVAAMIEGFKDPLLLLLFMKDGYADMLEGAAIEDSTVGVDLTNVRFTIT
jgi:hypothetical protein